MNKEDKIKAIAKKIQSRLYYLNMNKLDFAKAMNVVPSQVTRFISGSHNFTLDTLIRIEHTLGINLIDIDLESVYSGRPCAPCTFFKNTKE